MLRAARENTLPFRSHRLQEKTQTKIPPISCAGWARSPAVWLQGAPHDALGESVHPAPLAVPRGRLEGLVALRGSDGRGEGLAERRLLLLAGGERGAALRLLCVAAEAVPRHLEHQDAAVALGELAALEKVHRAEAGVAHQRVRADLLLEPPAEVDRRLDCLDLGRRDAVGEVVRGDAAIAEQRRQLLLARRHVLLQRAGRRLRFLKERGELGDRGERERRACTIPPEPRTQCGFGPVAVGETVMAVLTGGW